MSDNGQENTVVKQPEVMVESSVITQLLARLSQLDGQKAAFLAQLAPLDAAISELRNALNLLGANVGVSTPSTQFQSMMPVTEEPVILSPKTHTPVTTNVGTLKQAIGRRNPK
jgi:hypothetical protein